MLTSAAHAELASRGHPRHILLVAAAGTLLHACSGPVATPPPSPPVPARAAPSADENAPTSRVPRIVDNPADPPPKLAFTSCLARSGEVWAPVPIAGTPSTPSADAALPAADREAEQRIADATGKLARACYEAVHHGHLGTNVWLVVRTKLSATGDREEVCGGSAEQPTHTRARDCALRAMTSRGLFPLVAGKQRTVTGWFGFQRAASSPPRP
jgi:hypothetical protein